MLSGFEALEQMRERAARRLSEIVVNPPVVQTISDIQRLMKELDPTQNKSQPPVSLKTTMNTTEDGKTIAYEVKTTTRSKSKREILLEGFDVIKARQAIADNLEISRQPLEINGRVVKSAIIGNSISGQNWVDQLLKLWFNAYRDGIYICWNLVDGYRYKYDIYQHRLTRVKSDGH